MARIRTIKPEFWRHEGLSALPEATHLLAAALLNYADDEGYFNANPALIKADCSPLREPSVSIQESITLLEKEGYLALGTGPNDRRYGRILRFTDHQKVNRPSPSKIKSLPIQWDNSSKTHELFSEDSLPEQGTGNREQGTGNGTKPCRAAPDGAVDRIFDHWKKAHNHPRAKLDEKRRKLIRARLRDYPESDLCRAITGFLNSPHHMGQNTRDTKYDDLELFLRDAKHVDMGLKFLAEPPRSGMSAQTRKILDATAEWQPPEARAAKA